MRVGVLGGGSAMAQAGGGKGVGEGDGTGVVGCRCGGRYWDWLLVEARLACGVET